MKSVTVKKIRVGDSKRSQQLEQRSSTGKEERCICVVYGEHEFGDSRPRILAERAGRVRPFEALRSLCDFA